MRIRGLRRSARRRDCCQEEVLYSVVGGQFAKYCGWSDRNLAKSQATKRKLERGLKKSEGRSCATQSPSGQPQQDRTDLIYLRPKSRR